MEARTLKQIASECDGVLHGDGNFVIQRISTDSRRIQPGDLFVALEGERFDGHDFLEQVAAGGASGAMVNTRAHVGHFGLPVVQVSNTKAALGQFAASYRRDFKPTVIGVGGSNGKTTTKELIAAVLNERFETVWSEASFNNNIGVPLTLLQIERQHQVAVVEVGTNHPGELASLVRMVRPEIGVLTSLGREHLEFFGDMAGVCQEEGALAELLPKEGTFYFGADNEWGEAMLHRTQATVVRAGFSDRCDWRVSNVRLSMNGTTFSVVAPESEFSGSYQVPLIGRHHAVNSLFAVAIAARLGMSRIEIQRGLEHAKPAPHRMELRRCGAFHVLDDCYNANADSMRMALQTLAELPCKGTRIAVIGDMAELGTHAAAAHAETGRLAAELDFGQLLVTGELAGVTTNAARGAGLHRVLEFANTESMTDALRKLVRPGDLVLLKASRRMRLERVTEAICDEERVLVH